MEESAEMLNDIVRAVEQLGVYIFIRAVQDGGFEVRAVKKGSGETVVRKSSGAKGGGETEQLREEIVDAVEDVLWRAGGKTE